MFDDISNVAAQVHCDTMTAAVSPTPTFRPAVLNISEVWVVPLILNSYQLSPTVKIVKKIPNPRMTTNPTAWLRGAVGLSPASGGT